MQEPHASPWRFAHWLRGAHAVGAGLATWTMTPSQPMCAALTRSSLTRLDETSAKPRTERLCTTSTTTKGRSGRASRTSTLMGERGDRGRGAVAVVDAAPQAASATGRVSASRRDDIVASGTWCGPYRQPG